MSVNDMAREIIIEHQELIQAVIEKSSLDKFIEPLYEQQRFAEIIIEKFILYRMHDKDIF